jgi:methionyl-tRNA formyltransferase
MYHTLLNGDAETGVSIIDIHPERIDAGDVLLQRRFVRPLPFVAALIAAVAVLNPSRESVSVARATGHALSRTGA